ncbi:Inosose isomerase [bacterium HR17]|uniref:Inosose isomerase n=1 Tax=Candidatus Fervidibacter japonicus TaxID=2035412 RepID=A0A2H5XDV9_9BACT|nr:Inosose isomerase [bacterium HR17]
MVACLNPGTVGGGLSYEEFVALAKRHGFPAVEFGIEWLAEKASKEGVSAAREWLAQQGVTHAAFWLPVRWRDDEAAFQASLQTLPQKAQTAQAIGCTACVTYIPPSVPDDPVAFRGMVVRRFREVCAVLADYGVRLGIEWVAPAHFRQSGNPTLWRMDQALELCDAIGAPNIGLLVDSFHWFCAQHTLDELRALPHERIVHVHINDAPDRPVDAQVDNERVMPGEGIIDLVGFVRALRAAGYDGAVSVEVLSKTLPQQFSKDELAAWAKRNLDQLLAQVV